MEDVSRQAGVVSRRQLRERGWTDPQIRRAVRRRDLVPVQRGVYVDHTGEPTWEQRAWAAVLSVWPAALCDVSALRAYGAADAGPRIHVAVDRKRSVRAPMGAVLHYRVLNDIAAWHLAPPRVIYEQAVIDVAVRQRRRVDTIGVLSDAVGSRRTTAERLLATVAARARLPDRAWIHAVLHDIDAGTWSVLEHGYLDLVERPHGLPAALRQVRHVGTSGTIYRDAELPGLAIIELDGHRHHTSSRDRDRDLQRDLEAAARSGVTLRLGYGQVFDRPCSTAFTLAAILGRLGWEGTAHSCGPTCLARP